MIKVPPPPARVREAPVGAKPRLGIGSYPHSFAPHHAGPTLTACTEEGVAGVLNLATGRAPFAIVVEADPADTHRTWLRVLHGAASALLPLTPEACRHLGTLLHAGAARAVRFEPDVNTASSPAPEPRT